MSNLEKVGIINRIGIKYPTSKYVYRPHVRYPEYKLGDISHEQNEVYDMVRECLSLYGLDKEKFGTKDWNPFSNIIKEGNTVLIKPNLVLHKNLSGCGEDCLYTNPSVVAAVVDYVIIALNGTGKIIVGDAPVQECNFERLVYDSGYHNLIKYYKSKGINIELIDFRNIKTYVKNGIRYLQDNEGQDGVIVKLNKQSAFDSLDNQRISGLRITNYDPRIIQKHHDKYHHEYKVTQSVLDADVIINIPKPKTHRKAGVTISLKNMVGINANKEYLPHHSLGSHEEGGDAYERKNYYLTKANEILDLRNELVHNGDMRLAEEAEKFYKVLLDKGIAMTKEKYWEGSWYGNDTIWRMIQDINKIVLYADKDGNIKERPQRKMFIVADMIVSGQKEGPLEPVPNYSGIIAVGSNPLIFDRVICSIMGFDYKLIPSLSKVEIDNANANIKYKIVSNNMEWNGKDSQEISRFNSLEFQPTIGWVEKLGNKYINHLIKKVEGKEVFIFGAGLNGKYAYSILKRNQVEVRGFFDNDKKLWGKEIEPGVMCFDPKTIEKGTVIIGGVKDKFAEEIKREVSMLEGCYYGTINC